MSKVRDVVRARIKARIAEMEAPKAPGLDNVTLERQPSPKTKAELQDELDVAGIAYPKDARKADLEALLPQPDAGVGEA